jgi:hypothetical protein
LPSTSESAAISGFHEAFAASASAGAPLRPLNVGVDGAASSQPLTRGIRRVSVTGWAPWRLTEEGLAGSCQSFLSPESQRPLEWPEWIDRLRHRVLEETPARREWAEKAGNFILQLMDLSDEVLLDASSAPDNWHVVLRAMGSPEMLRQMQASDPLANAFLRGIEARTKLVRENGGVFSTEQVARYLDITQQAVTKRRHSRQLLGLTFRRRGCMYPAWQFIQSGTVPGLHEVLMALAEHDEWMQNVFFITPNTRLAGRRPLEYLRSGQVAEVIDAAKEFGQRGAE